MMIPTITKEIFVNSIESLRIQHYQDSTDSKLAREAFGMNGALYDNTELKKSVIALLRLFFPRHEDGHCPIEHYCWMTGFGKMGTESEIISVEDLWEEINKENG